jgi:2-amino-4-hydroxy-6-hydroxymethyldihydropteridine diphosphokinase
VQSSLSDYAFLSIGANLPGDAGHPLATLERAVEVLRGLSDAPLIVSPYYESDPKDCPPGSPRYCNAVVALKPRADATALSLLLQLQGIEAGFGRVRSGIVNEARTLDLDLLTFPGTTSDTAQLTLPHPRAHERRFVLEPWIAIAGEEWPFQQRTLGEWLKDCDDPPLVKIAADSP